MSNALSIIPFLRPLALALLLVPTVACYDKDDVYAPDEPATIDGAAEVDWDREDDVNPSDGSDETPEDPDSEDATDGDDDTDPAGGSEEFVCAFGKKVADMPEADQLELGAFEHLVGIDALGDDELDQLLRGAVAFDWFDIGGDLDALFARIEGQRVLVRQIELLTTGQTFTHLRFHGHDEEYGFLFLEDSLRLVAAVDSGEILACTVSL